MIQSIYIDILSIGIRVWKWGQIYILPQFRDLVFISIFAALLLVIFNDIPGLGLILNKEKILLNGWLGQELIFDNKITV